MRRHSRHRWCVAYAAAVDPAHAPRHAGYGSVKRGGMVPLLVLLLSVGALAILASGCRSEKQPAGTADPVTLASWDGFSPAAGPVLVGHAIKPSDLTESERQYGVAPKRIPGLVYKDDVILMENGDKAIRSLSSDGMTWTLDARSPHVNEIQVGKIVFATSRCVGKVLGVEHKGNDVSAILGPVQITDLVKQGNFSYEQPLDLDSVMAIGSPDYPGAPNSAASQQMENAGNKASLGTPGSSRSVSYFVVTPEGDWKPMPTIYPDGTARVIRAGWDPSHASGIPLLASPSSALSDSFSVHAAQLPIPNIQMVNGMQMSPCKGCGGLGLRLYQEKGGVKVWLTAVFHLSSPVLKFNVGITSDGSINAYVSLSGAAGFTVTLDAVATQDLKVNLKEVGAVPWDLTVPLGGMGVPLQALFQQAIVLETAFSAKTSVLHASGDFTAAGALSMSYVHGRWDVPPLQMTLKQNLADAVSGVSVGINSLVFAITQRLMVGVGGLGFAAGPYVSLTTNTTALKQSSITLVDCRQGTFGMQLSGGIGFSMPKVVAKVINFFLSLVHVAPVPASGTIVALKNPVILVNRTDQIPNGCAGH